ncbi:MAG: hypothetical protein JWO60_1870 [Frankiales bacterium]|nr:hypothetical protein [Frankiales bacterium]
MFKKLTLAVGFGAGYVLGAKAGTQRYDQIVAKARELAGMPAVQEVTSNLTSTASTLADTAKSKANETIENVASTSTASSATSAPETVDLTTGTTTSGYETGAAPITGAAASDTV